MKNKNKKKCGAKYEQELLKILESKGFLCMRCQRTMRCIGPGRWISQDNDFWNLYDICAKKDRKTFWIQVKHDKTGSNVSSSKKPIEEFSFKHTCNSEFCIIAWHKPRKGWKYLNYCGTKWDEVDLDGISHNFER